MRFENRRWLVIPTSIIGDIDFNQVHESNADSLRKSVDETLTFVKYEVNIVEESNIVLEPPKPFDKMLESVT